MNKETIHLRFAPLLEPTQAIADAFGRWENDPILIPLTRPNQHAEDLAQRRAVTCDELAQRLSHDRIYLIYLNGELVGEMSYQVDPAHLFKREPGTAWLGITIGEARGRGRGVGYDALRYLERQIARHDLRRIELGVFAFNTAALHLYQRLGYAEIGRIGDFTYWQGRMWDDIRLEKYLSAR